MQTRRQYSRLTRQNRMLQIRFILFGLLSTALASVTLPVLYFATQIFWVAATGTAAICISFSYICNRNYVFRSQDNVSTESVRFISGALIISAIGSCVSYVSLQKFGAENYLLANTTINIALGLTSYAFHNTVSFLKNKRAK